MTESLSKPSEKSGMRPGSLVHVGNVHEPTTRITVIDYNQEKVEQAQLISIDQILKYKASETVTWLVIEGLTNIEIIENIGKEFDIHQLVLEDILNTHQRPKFEDYDDYFYIVLKCLISNDKSFRVCYEQVSLLVLKNFVLVFKEKTDDLFNPVLQRIQSGKGRFRRLGADYLTYAILDTIVDQNFIMIDLLDEAITSLEESLLNSEPTRDTLNTIHKLKREVIGIRRHISPIRELLAAMLRSDSELISEQTRVYLRDVSDHSIRIVESIELYRDILTGLLEIYLSSISNKINEVMKVLTVFASIFIPLTFIAGIYGMNFEYMPELKWKWAYPLLWAAFITIPLVLLVYFKKKKWL